MDQNLGELIRATAQSLGIDPLDLGTAISYETAGTFDPTKRGPTTKWGQHRGFIQFGEPQARQYGVDWNNPIASQLGPDGAVAKYLRDTGVRPGMGLMDVYSAINAGGVGRYNASDAASGGAPGTVADKVRNQMAGHRQNAEKLLGGTAVASPTAPPSAGPQPQQPQQPQQPDQPAMQVPKMPEIPLMPPMEAQAPVARSSDPGMVVGAAGAGLEAARRNAMQPIDIATLMSLGRRPG